MGKGFTLSKKSEEVARSRYFMNGENWESCTQRASNVLASCEMNRQSKIRDSFFDIMVSQYFIPGGRILRNAGRPRGSLFNCYHLPVGDSIDEIGQFIKDSLILWSEGGGVGCNFSSLRPKGDAILGKGGSSSGLVSFIEAADAVSHTIESGGSRRAAAIAHVDINHPEVMDFIDSKLVHGRLAHFNISVSVNEDFLQRVEQDGEWTFKFKQKKYGTVKARDLWNKIVKNMIECGEPGLINWTNFAKNNSYYFSPVLGTNPCGETTLGPYESCDLGSLVLPNFITSGNINTNWEKLKEVVKIAVRFLDNVIDVNKYALKDIDINAHKSRRIGIGVIGLAEYLFMKKVRYGSEQAIRHTEAVMRAIRDAAYQASIELAVEKGAFPMFDPVQYGKASFIRKLPAELRMDIKKYGVRNCTVMALAPTGTISLLTNYSSAIEPVFSKALKRHDRISERIYIHPKYEELLKTGDPIPDWFVDSYDLEAADHFAIQAACQRFCDGAVSKTINLPAETTEEELSSLLLEYIRDLKGVTVYRDGCREGQILTKLSNEEIMESITQNKTDNDIREVAVECASGSCEI